jgi:hypothetical protein
MTVFVLSPGRKGVACYSRPGNDLTYRSHATASPSMMQESERNRANV